VGQKTHPKGFRLVTTQKHLSEWYTTKFKYPSLIEEDYFIRNKIQDFFKESLSISKIEIDRSSQEENSKEYVNIKILALFPREKEMPRKINKYFSNSLDSNNNFFELQKNSQNLKNIENGIEKSQIEKNENISVENVSLTEEKEILKNSENFQAPISSGVESIEENNELTSSFSLKTLTNLTNAKENLKEFTAFILKRNIRNLIRFFQLKTQKNYFVTIKFIRNPFEDPVLIAKFIADQLEKRTPFRRAVKQTIKKVQRTTLKGIKVQVSGRLNGADIARSEWKRDGKIPLHTLKARIDYTHQIAKTIYGIIGIKVWLFLGNKEI
jgi:ribosomal protein S3